MEFHQRLSNLQHSTLPRAVYSQSTGVVYVRSRFRSAVAAIGLWFGAIVNAAAASFTESTLTTATQALAAAGFAVVGFRFALRSIHGDVVISLDRAGVRAAGRTLAWPAIRATQLLERGLRIDVHDAIEPSGDLVLTGRGVDWSVVAGLVEAVAFGPPEWDAPSQ